MPDNTLKISATADLLGLNAAMNEGAASVRSAIDRMLVSFSEASTGSARAVARISEDTRAGATAVSNEWVRVAQSTLAYNAALKETSAATYLARKAGEDDASATLLLAAAKQKAALAARELAAAEKAVAVSEEEASGVAGMLGGALGKVLGSFIGLEVLRRLIDDTANFEIRMRNLSLMTGIAAQSLAGLHDVVKERGGDFDAIAVSLTRMEKAQQLAVEGNKEAIAGFQRIGISVQELKTLQPEELLYRVAKGFNEMRSSDEKSTAAFEIFGRGGRALIPVFAELGSQLREHVQRAGEVSGVTDKNIESAQEYKTIMEQLGVEVRSFTADSLGPLLGAINFTEGLLDALFDIAISAMDAVGAFAMSVVHGLTSVAKAAKDVVTGHLGAIKGDFSEAGHQIKGEWTGLAHDVTQMWREVTPELMHPMDNLKDFLSSFSPPQIKPLGLEDDLPGAGATGNRLNEWKQELQAKRDAEDGFHQVSKSEEASFWESKLAIAQGDAKLYAQVYHEMRQAEREEQKESLKDELAGVAERVAATKAGSLERVLILNEEVATMKSLGRDQTEDYKRLNVELAAATREYAEQQAKAVVEADRQKVESTHRASDARVAAERAVLEDLKRAGLQGTAEYTAQLKAVNDAEKQAAAEKEKLGQLEIEQEKIRALAILEVRKQQIQADFDMHRINSQQRIALLKGLESQQYEIEKQALQKELALAETNPNVSQSELQKRYNQIENLTREHNNKIAQLNTQAVKDSQQKYDQFFSHINSGSISALNGALTGHQSFMRGMMNLWNSGVEYIVDKMALIGLKWFEQHVIMRAISTLFHAQEQADEIAAQGVAVAAHGAANLTMGISDAAKAATGTLAYYSSFAPEIAPAMAAAAYGEGISWASLATFHLGGISDTEQMAILKRNEMVLDPVLSAGFQKMLGSGNAPAASPSPGGHRVWTGDVNIHGAGNPQEVADLAVEQMKTYFRTGGVHRR